MLKNYIQKSRKRGTYSYRRAIPKELHELWGKREYKQSLKTKDFNAALRLAAKVNENFEHMRDKFVKQLKGEDVSSTPDRVWYTIEQAEKLLRDHEIHPDQNIPDDQLKTHRDMISLFYEIYADHKEVRDIETGERLFRHESPLDVMDQAKAILEGRGRLLPPVSLRQATEYYLRQNQEQKERDAYDQRKFEQAVQRASKRLADFLGSDQFKLNDLTAPRVRQFRDDLMRKNPNWSPATVNKDLQRLAAIFNLANRQFEMGRPTVFSGLKLQAKTKKIGRPFTPDELRQYRQFLLSKKNDQVRLIGLLMIATGARTKEITGLRMDEVRLDANVPHIKIRFNEIARVKNASSERDVPVVGEALEHLRQYISNRDALPHEPAFPSYGRPGGSDSVSSLLNKIIREKMGVRDPKLVAYSARHTMKDKLRAIQTPHELQLAIVGHSSNNPVADGYGAGHPLTLLQTELVKANECVSWGPEG